jgi:cyclopropane-fatty-acyl-phospholipid synthase
MSATAGRVAPAGGLAVPDPTRWPDLARIPRARARAAIASALVRRVAARVPLRIELPDGTLLGRPGDVASMRLHRPKAFLRRLGVNGLIGFGESYQAGEWDSDDLPRLIGVFADHVEALVPRKLQWLRHFHGAKHPLAEENTVDGSRSNIARHYDLSNDLFSSFLDETMMYSSAVFDTDASEAPIANQELMPAAQRRKLDHLLDRCAVGPGSRVLEIGTGWGELAIRAAMRGATVHTVTISREQRALAIERIAEAGLADRVTVELCDYREIPASHNDSVDAIVSIEMIEAVGESYWPAYFSTLDRLLAPGGRIGLQAITMRHERLVATRKTYTWMHKYVFPGGLIPSVKAIEDVCRRHTRLRVQDLRGFGQHYAHTLRLWRERFNANTARVAALGFDEPFRRTWNLYLAYCEAGFATGYLDVHQLVLGRSSGHGRTDRETTWR